MPIGVKLQVIDAAAAVGGNALTTAPDGGTKDQGIGTDRPGVLRGWVNG